MSNYRISTFTWGVKTFLETVATVATLRDFDIEKLIRSKTYLVLRDFDVRRKAGPLNPGP